MSAKTVHKLAPGDLVVDHELVTIQGEPVHVPDPERAVHVQFRRYGGCPICNLHLRSVAKRNDEIEAAGIREVVVFHSSADTMREFQSELPFAVIADPEKKLYAEFGVESSPKAVLSLKSQMAAMQGMASQIRRAGLKTTLGLGEQLTGLPADFLIASDGRVLASKYGANANDQWSVDELLSLARSS
jgi:peroxiredoxin